MAGSEGFYARRRGRYGSALVATLVTILATVVLPEEGWARIVLPILQGGMLWLAFVAAGLSRSLVRLAILMWLLAAVLAGVAIITDVERSGSVSAIISVILIAGAGAVILRNLVIGGRITVASVGGVLTVYLLIGLFFTYVYETINLTSDTPPLNGADTIDRSTEVYFAFITLTTVGYGDLTPATDLVRGLAITQALVGQLYLVSVVALVVSNLGRQAPEGGLRAAGEPEDEAPPD